MMSAERAERLRIWHEQAYLGSRRETDVTAEHFGLTIVVPPDVYPPNPLGLADLVLREVRPEDRVLDMGTGSGINALAAATQSRDVVAVDISPSAVSCARENVARNRMTDRVDVQEGDLFATVGGQFDLIVFDPPFRWFRPRDMRERAIADEDYETLTQFFHELPKFLKPRGRLLLSFGTTGDIDYLHTLIQDAALDATELRKVEFVKEELPVAYFAWRLTPASARP